MGTPLTQCKVIIIAPSFITMSLYLYFNVLILQKPFSQGFKGLPIPFFDVVTVIVEVDILDPKRLYCLSLFFCLFFRLFPGPCLCFSFCLSLCLGSCPFLRLFPGLRHDCSFGLPIPADFCPCAVFLLALSSLAFVSTAGAFASSFTI